MNQNVQGKMGRKRILSCSRTFIIANLIVFHVVDTMAKDLEKAGYKKLSKRDN